MEKGQKVKTIFGDIETVLDHSGSQVTTYESAVRLSWYHPTKVFPIKEETHAD